MNSHAAQLLAEALRLPEEERSAMAARLIASFDPATEEDAKAAWAEEVRDYQS